MKKVIYIIEKNDSLRDLYLLLLTRNNYVVYVFSSVKHYEETNLSSPDLFIINARLNSIEEIALCKILKDNINTRDIPVILIASEILFLQQSVKVGANSFLLKPFDIDDLLKTISDCFQNDF